MNQQNTPIYSGYQAGALSRLCTLQSEYYDKEWSFTKDYEAVVAHDMGLFLKRYNHERDLFLTVKLGDVVQGGVIIDGGELDGDWARLRWFILSPALRGMGVGKELMQRAVSFIKEKGYDQTYLKTFDGLTSARHLYESVGFKLVQSKSGDTWGKPVIEQRFELIAST